jgi:excisionase family DNA binding protein
MFTVREAALLLGISKSAMYEHIARDLIDVVQIGASIRISPSTLEALLGERPPSPHELHEAATPDPQHS